MALVERQLVGKQALLWGVQNVRARREEEPSVMGKAWDNELRDQQQILAAEVPGLALLDSHNRHAARILQEQVN